MPYSGKRCKIWETRYSPSIKGNPREKENGVGKKSHEGKFSIGFVHRRVSATLDAPDRWRRGWYCNNGLHRNRSQQGGGGVMFWGAIIGNELVGLFKVADRVKMTAKLYIDFIKEHLEPCYNKKNLSFRKKLIFIHGNALLQAAKVTTEYLERVLPDNWQNIAMPSLLSRLRIHRKSVEYLEKEDLLRRKAEHL